MRKILIWSLFIWAGFSFAQEANKVEKINWIGFEEAIALNETNPKLIFVDVYTDWCGWCKRMDASTFSEEKVAKYMNEKYYCVKLDAEGSEPVNYMGKTFTNPNPDGRRSTHQIAALLLQNKLSYPSYVFMNEQNKVLTVVKGFMDVAKFDPIIHWFGEKVYLTQTYQEYIKTYTAE
ncbi:MAG: thioredoxin [Bacteroidetes bacterium 4572_77]|nr:MAG: thioredoxin [Bacteroidetes bacterium 4572_77]